MKPWKIAAVFALALAGCSPNAQEGSDNVGDAAAADPGATMNDAVRTVDEASDKAFGAAERSMDRLGNASGRVRDDAGNATAE